MSRPASLAARLSSTKMALPSSATIESEDARGTFDLPGCLHIRIISTPLLVSGLIFLGRLIKKGYHYDYL